MNLTDSKEPGKLADQQIDYLKVLRIIWSRWYWVAGSVFIAILIAYVHLWYTPTIYSTSASLKFEEKKSEFSELLKASGSYYDRTNKVQSEMYVIQSRDVLLNAISRLDYKISYYLTGRIRTTEMYPQVPFPIEIIYQDSLNFNRTFFEIKNSGNSKFQLSYNQGTNRIENEYHFGDTIKFQNLTFRVKSTTVPVNAQYSFKFNTKEDFLGRVAGGLAMKEAAKSSNVLLLTQTDQNIAFASDVLDATLMEYVYFDGSQRIKSASQTIEFIESQLQFLSSQVQRSGSALEEFKQRKNIVDPSTNTKLTVEKLTEQESQKSILKIEELAINQLENQILNNKDQVELNFSLGGTVDPLLSGLIAQLNTVIAEREKKLRQFNPDSSPVQEAEVQIAEIKKAIINNIRLSRERNRKTIRYIDNQIILAQQNLNVLPSAERDFLNLQSDFNINQKVFSYLSEKKLEAQISRAAVIPGATIVDQATKSSRIVSPLPGKVYTTAVIAGIAAGLLIIMLIRLSNPYIYDKETVESLTSTPIIGVIRKFPDFIDKDNRQILSLSKPKSVFAESVRSVRTNLSFLASEKKSKIICVTSEIAGEGKSFVTVNLASTLALIDKRVILIAADLRRSKLHKTFNDDNKVGLSSYLSNQAKLSDIVKKTDIPELDFLPSGPVPPNPAELLHSHKMNELIEELSALYDFILVDTAPVGLVSDSVPLIRKADTNLFVIRSGVSKYNAATIPDRITNEYGLNNVVIVLNAFGDDALHSRYYSTNYATSYNSNYYYYSDYSGKSNSGYYTDEEKQKWWQIWKRA